MPSASKIGGHGNGEKVNAKSSSEIPIAATLGEELRDGVDSVVDSIGACQRTVI